LLSASWERLEERLEFIGRNVGEISKWVEFKTTLDKLNPELRRIFDKCMSVEERGYKIGELYEKVFLQAYLSQMNLDLARRSREYLDMIYGKFVESDREHKYYSRNQIIGMIEAKKPKIGLTSRSSEVGILSKEISKSRRHKPLRKLFSEIKNLVFVLKPCFMMSPLSVARFIDPEVMEFDTVIFDEASQVMVEDSISSIIRSKQVIIVGDSKQLPPTMFFKVNEDMDVEEGLEEATSILDEASAAMGTQMLRWHYRSRDESLINFSNRNFYNGDLITFPNNLVDSFAIDFTYVRNGVYERGGSRQNKIEAKKVVELIKQHLDATPEKSLGIIAFSIAQQQAILEELDHFVTWHPSYHKLLGGDGLRGFFVKNLETVQGDERDVIIISVGYGRDSEGHFTMNFGPLNRDGGIRRLNVAISRAVERVNVVSSILPEDINEARAGSEGMVLLKRYLQYARAGEAQSKRQNEFESELQEAVYKRLLALGLAVDKSVGSSRFNIDVAIRSIDDDNRYALALELDGKAYGSARSTRDRDRIRREMLESLGWKVHRIWSYDWMLNPDKESERILELLKMPDAAIRAKDDDEKKHTRVHAAENELSFAIKEYPTIVCPVLGSPDDFMKLDFFSKVRDIVKSEGPIHRDLLMKRLFECYGVKEGVRTKNRFDEVLDSHLPVPDVTIEGELYWAQEPKFMFNIRRSDAEIRSMNYIPLPEIRLAVLLVVSNGISISNEDIPKEVAAIFGAPKMSPKFKARVNLATEELIERKYLSEDSGKIIVNKDFQRTADESEKKEKEESKKGKGDKPPKGEFESHFRSKLPGGDDSSNVVFR
jgi:very-short-patch-repair endonuclease